MNSFNYQDLDVWKKGIDIGDLIYDLTAGFGRTEKYGLGQHMRRISESIPSNIAEGAVRQYTKEYMQFCYIALGSCAELETQVVLAGRRKLIDGKDDKELREYLNHEIRMIRNLIKSLRKRGK